MFQPLDVGIFGPFKHALDNESFQYEKETGQDVDKDAVLLVIGRAFHQAFTMVKILSAFRKTGISPFDRTAIKLADISRSKKSAALADAPKPLPPTLKKVIQVWDDASPLRAPDFVQPNHSSSLAFP